MLAKLHPAIRALAVWTYKNVFAFSTDKTCCMDFHQRLHYPAVQNLKLYHTKIPVPQTVTFLDLYWDSPLNWKICISQLKISCQRALNLLWILSSREWGASQYVLLEVYRLTIRSKIDYGYLVYGAAAQTVLNRLKMVHNEALRLYSESFKSTPAESLYVLINEQSLQDRRINLMCRYYKNKCHILNPAYTCAVNQWLEMFLTALYHE